MDDYLKHTKEALEKITQEANKENHTDESGWYTDVSSESIEELIKNNKSATFVNVPIEQLYTGNDPEEKEFMITVLRNLSSYYLGAFEQIVEASIKNDFLLQDAFKQLSTFHQIVMSQMHKKIMNDENGDRS